MNAWVGPAIVAAVISSTLGVLSLYVNAWLTIGLERKRRQEKVRDVQIALLAEIRADIHNLKFFDLDENLAVVSECYETIHGYVARPTLSPQLLLEDLLRSETWVSNRGAGRLVRRSAWCYKVGSAWPAEVSLSA
jgi:hypothetical protein